MWWLFLIVYVKLSLCNYYRLSLPIQSDASSFIILVIIQAKLFRCQKLCLPSMLPVDEVYSCVLKTFRTKKNTQLLQEAFKRKLRYLKKLFVISFLYNLWCSTSLFRTTYYTNSIFITKSNYTQQVSNLPTNIILNLLQDVDTPTLSDISLMKNLELASPRPLLIHSFISSFIFTQVIKINFYLVAFLKPIIISERPETEVEL